MTEPEYEIPREPLPVGQIVPKGQPMTELGAPIESAFSTPRCLLTMCWEKVRKRGDLCPRCKRLDSERRARRALGVRRRDPPPEPVTPPDATWAEKLEPGGYLRHRPVPDLEPEDLPPSPEHVRLLDSLRGMRGDR